MGMTKSELIEHLVDAHPDLQKNDATKVVDTILDEITEALARGDRVELRGFAAFSVKKRNARTGRNPRTGEEVVVPQKTVPYFKPGKEIRERLKEEGGS